MNSKKPYCTNCCKCGHNLKECIEPIISYGIICMKITDDLIYSPSIIENFLINKVIDIDEYNLFNLNNLSKIDKYKNNIKFLIIQRKHSFSYVEFIRGKYDETNLETITALLNLMSIDEINLILNNNFPFLWNNLWQKTSTYKAYQKEYEISNTKFNYIKQTYELNKIINFDNLYKTPEWGFPKGRKDRKEKSIDCAIREFEEETSLDPSKYILLNRLDTIEELAMGNQNTLYKLVYYLALAFDEYAVNINNEYQKYEIGDIRWLTYEEIIPMIRDYDKDKINLIHKVYFMMLNFIEEIKNKQTKEKLINSSF